ncbi:Hypothetical predicted protein [Mytilus galloprovincialis]|uniref:Uncharacterized protein n=1 Tax=Mytilus galloprovincialis TaxID=29158 RepID=A0A8B6CMY2_MYTGA|nr:Hypothetical predicted protein [Mytilus galloprovincialis]
MEKLHFKKKAEEGKWIKYSSKQICSKNNVNDQAIYLNNVGNHYEVVLSVLPGGKEEVTLNSKESAKKQNQSGAEKDQMNLNYELSHEGTMKRKYEQHELTVPKKVLKREKNSFGLIVEEKYLLERSRKEPGVCEPPEIEEGFTKSEKEKMKYQWDPQFRFNKLEKKKMRYKQDKSYKEGLIQTGKEKYMNDAKYRQYIQQASKDKYISDQKYRESKKIGSIQKYANDEEHKRKVKQASIQKYADDDEFKREVKQASIQKYADDDEFKRKLKDQMLTRRQNKYADDDISKGKSNRQHNKICCKMIDFKRKSNSKAHTEIML